MHVEHVLEQDIQFPNDLILRFAWDFCKYVIDLKSPVQLACENNNKQSYKKMYLKLKLMFQICVLSSIITEPAHPETRGIEERPPFTGVNFVWCPKKPDRFWSSRKWKLLV